jgi:hypothetical protein
MSHCRACALAMQSKTCVWVSMPTLLKICCCAAVRASAQSPASVSFDSSSASLAAGAVRGCQTKCSLTCSCNVSRCSRRTAGNTPGAPFMRVQSCAAFKLSVWNCTGCLWIHCGRVRCSSCRVSAMQSTSFTALERPCACSAAGMRVAICQSGPITKLPPPVSLASVTMLTACAGSLLPSQSLPFNWSRLLATNASMSSSPSLLHCCNRSCAFLQCQVLCLSALPSPVPFCTAASAFVHCRNKSCAKSCRSTGPSCLRRMPACLAALRFCTASAFVHCRNKSCVQSCYSTGPSRLTNASMSSSPSLLHCCNESCAFLHCQVLCLSALLQQVLCLSASCLWNVMNCTLQCFCLPACSG